MIIALFLDSWWRDAYTIVPIKLELEKLGATVHVVPFSLWSDYLQLIKPNHAVLNHAIGDRNGRIIDIVKRNGGTISIVPTEGRPNTKAQEDWYSSQDGLPNWFFHWSSQTQKGFKTTPGNIVGCPRFEHYNNTPDREIVLHKHGLDTSKKTLLFATSFPQAKFYNVNSQFNKKDWDDLGVPFDAETYASNEYHARQKSLILLWLLAEATDYQIVVRPHPMEDSRWWERNMPPFVHLITQEFIQNLIPSADVLVNRVGCMTTMEAWLANIPVLSVKYLDRELLSGPAKEVYDIQAYKQPYLNVIGNIPELPEKKPIKLLKKYGLLRAGCAQAIASKIVEITPENSHDIPLQNMTEWAKILIKHNDKTLVPNPGFHPGKDSPKFRVDNLTYLLQEK